MTKKGFHANLGATQVIDRLDHMPSYLDPEPNGAYGIMP